MKKILLFVQIILLLSSAFRVNAECNEETKKKVDMAKETIPYPKYNIGDVLYIAFINSPYISTNHVAEKDVEIKKVRIVDMRLQNTIGGPDLLYGVYLDSVDEDNSFPLEWVYQYVDNNIREPRNKDCSDFYEQDRFFDNINSAKKSLITKP